MTDAMTPDELEQRLWELEYGLLPDDEAAALRARIDSDPEVARTQQRVLANSKILAQAAKVDAPLVRFRIPQSDDQTELSQSRDQSIAGDFARRIRRIANWSLS